MAKDQVCHVEWDVTDIAKAQQFYEGLFGWKFTSFGDEMVVFGNGADHIGGLSKAAKVTPSQNPSIWIEVDDIEAYRAKASKVGGSTGREKQALPHVGWTA